jgi:hypothetical protein
VAEAYRTGLKAKALSPLQCGGSAPIHFKFMGFGSTHVPLARSVRPGEDDGRCRRIVTIPGSRGGFLEPRTRRHGRSGRFWPSGLVARPHQTRLVPKPDSSLKLLTACHRLLAPPAALRCARRSASSAGVVPPWRGTGLLCDIAPVRRKPSRGPESRVLHADGILQRVGIDHREAPTIRRCSLCRAPPFSERRLITAEVVVSTTSVVPSQWPRGSPPTADLRVSAAGCRPG